MAIFSDGNMAENQLDKGNPLELGYDKWTNNLYANKQLLQNTVHYLMGENKRLILRSKEIRLAFLDQTLVREENSAYKQKCLPYPSLYSLCLDLSAALSPQSISSITFDKFLFGLLCFKIYLIV